MISEEAQALSQRMLLIHNRETDNIQITKFLKIQKELVSRESWQKELYRENAPYFLEAYLATILNPEIDIKFRSGLLKYSDEFLSVTTFNPSRGEMDVMFDAKASIWHVMDGSWFYPQLFSKENPPSEKDFLIARLRSQLNNLHQNDSDQDKTRQLHKSEIRHLTDKLTELTKDLERAKTQGNATGQTKSESTSSAEATRLKAEVAQLRQQNTILSSENTHLRNRNGRLEKFSQDIEPLLKGLEDRFKLFQKLGGHPLEILGIGQATWKNTPQDKRAELVQKSYRAQARKYHYQIPEGNPKFNEELKELKNEKFSQATQAKDFLDDNLGTDEF